MKSHFEFVAKPRNEIGTGASRRLRRAEEFPAIIYGANKPVQTISLDHNAIFHASENESFYSSVMTLKIGKEKQDVVFKAIQRHPYKPKIMHLDFLRIQADVELHMNIPLHFLNKEKSAGVKAGGVVSQLLTEIEITCLPKYLPEYLEVDLAKVQLGQTLHLSDILLPEHLKISSLIGEHPNNLPILSIHIPKVVAEPETVAAETTAAAAATPESAAPGTSAGNKKEEKPAATTPNKKGG